VAIDTVPAIMSCSLLPRITWAGVRPSALRSGPLANRCPRQTAARRPKTDCRPPARSKPTESGAARTAPMPGSGLATTPTLTLVCPPTCNRLPRAPRRPHPHTTTALPRQLARFHVADCASDDPTPSTCIARPWILNTARSSWRGAQARCDFAEALRFPAVLQCGAQPILQICQV
jgi:hypothetical protein